MLNTLRVVIQNSAKSPAIKLKPAFPLFLVEKFLAPNLYYPCNEGFMIPDETPVLVITPVPVLPGAIILCRPIGTLNKRIMAVPISKLTNLYDQVHTITDLPKFLLQQIKHFYEHTQASIA